MTTTTGFAPLTDADEEETSRYADLGWTKIHYNDIGTGFPVVLIHGGRLGATAWSNFTLNIRPLAEHFRVLAMDMPGFGKSAPHDGGPAGATVNAKAISEVLDQLGISKTHVLGNSMGGATALTFMVDFPEKTDKIIAMGPAPVGQLDWSRPSRRGDNSQQLVLEDPSNPDAWKVFYEAMVYDLSIVPQEILEKRMNSLQDPHQDQHRLNRLSRQQQMRGQGGGMGGPGRGRSLLDEFVSVKTKVLFIQGRNDTIVPPEATLMLMPYLENAELHLFNKCGHWAQYEHASRFNALSLDFLLND